MRLVQHLSVFLASPGDVQAERDEAREVIEEMNRTVGREKGVVLEAVGWETHTYPAYGQDPQGLVNDQIGDMTLYDLFIGIMRDRFGSPTPRAGSGTQEEFERAVEAFQRRGNPAIMLYFSTAPSCLATPEAAEQRAAVLRFKREAQGTALTADYADVGDFRKKFQRNLLQWLAQWAGATAAPLGGAAAPGAPSVPPLSEAERDVLLGGSQNGGYVIFATNAGSEALKAAEELADGGFLRRVGSDQYRVTRAGREWAEKHAGG